MSEPIKFIAPITEGTVIKVKDGDSFSYCLVCMTTIIKID
jgi:hypothetical protein